MKTIFSEKNIKGIFLLLLLLSFSSEVFAQDKERLKELREAQQYLSDATEEIQNEDFTKAEATYRKAISINSEDETAKYNLGNAYYNEAKNLEAMRRYNDAATSTEDKGAKHKAFHNLGNTFMNAKDYQNAVEAYKNALRNNPTDDETRYNLALAKDMLEKNPPQGGDGEDENEDKKDENEDKKENEEKKDDEGKEKEGDEGEDQEDKDKGDEKDENKEGDNEDKGKPDEPKDQKEGEKPKEQKPVPGQLSPQQVKNLLEAMNNEEKKVQDKINAKKQKGAKVKSNKDW